MKTYHNLTFLGAREAKAKNYLLLIQTINFDGCHLFWDNQRKQFYPPVVSSGR